MKHLKKKPDHTVQNTYALPTVFISQYGMDTREQTITYKAVQVPYVNIVNYRYLPKKQTHQILFVRSLHIQREQRWL